MGKTITTIIIAILIILGIYYVISNRTNTSTNGTNASSTVASSTDTTEFGSTTGTGEETGSSSTSKVSTSTSETVEIRNFTFTPTTLTVKVGTKVTWTNRDSVAHTVTSATTTLNKSMELNSPQIASGQSYSHTFSKAGTYNYYCTTHPNMKGAVIVK